MSNHRDRLRESTRKDRTRISAVALIYMREMRDQLRDRRTLFTIAVLPIMLYPIVGMLLLQIAQFTQKHPTSVCVVGTENLANTPELIVGESFAPELVGNRETLKLVHYEWNQIAEHTDVEPEASIWVREGAFDTVVLIPPSFANEEKRIDNEDAQIKVLYNVASDQSLVARDRVKSILNAWRGGWIRDRLSTSGYDLKLLDPFSATEVDIAPERTREAAFWSKLLPFIMLVWAMTGAFYPAIDLVAGEKERGTLETLLCSPALRSEIVWGKLGAVTTFSMLTALLNAGSMLVTSTFVFAQIGIANGEVGSPPLKPMLWLLVALVPLSALFSSLALAVAAIARSSKEGQYYLMPLMMITLPLVLLPMLPGTTLGIGTSMIPVTGMFLLVRALVEGQYTIAMMHLPLVFMITGICLWLATRWAKKQFEDEAVLFGGGEQWELGMWMRHLWRDRQTAATPGQALTCGAIILIALFFGKLAVAELPTTFAGLAKLVLLPQLVMILFPALMMATVLTTSLRKSLRIRRTHWTIIPLSVFCGIALHPAYTLLGKSIAYAYPISAEAAASMKPFVEQISNGPWLSVLLLFAFIPAICEELAFRGFVFGGLVRGNGKFRAVLVTAVMFGISHGVVQQSIAATFMGLLLGWVALRTGSVLPCILIHFTNNALSVSLERIANSGWNGSWVFLTTTESGPQYQPVWICVSIFAAVSCLMYFNSIGPAVDESEHDRIAGSKEAIDPSTSLATS